ncbi:MAG: glycosyltransferase [Candidatus Delongbacteria bacterium]|jgi:GT2 family glycosyltransferase|nr:glycosyltransferase [Candidatus Delongbacteria bacterium]
MIRMSIIIPTYNRPDSIKRTVNSILDHDTKNYYEIIVINDSPEHLIESFFDKKVTVVNNGENIGRSKARNKGASMAQGDILFFIDDDIEMKDNLFDTYVELMDGDFDAVFSNVNNIRTDGTVCVLNKFLNTRGANQKNFENNFKSNYFTSAFCGIKKDFFEKIGKFDENFKGYGWEDPELGMRIEKNGGKIKFYKTATLNHYHDKDIDQWVKQLENSGVNFKHIIEKYPENTDRFNYDFLTSWKAGLIFNPMFFAIGKMKTKLFGGMMNFIMYRYLFAGSIYRSLKE